MLSFTKFQVHFILTCTYYTYYTYCINRIFFNLFQIYHSIYIRS